MPNRQRRRSDAVVKLEQIPPNGWLTETLTQTTQFRANVSVVSGRARTCRWCSVRFAAAAVFLTLLAGVVVFGFSPAPPDVTARDVFSSSDRSVLGRMLRRARQLIADARAAARRRRQLVISAGADNATVVESVSTFAPTTTTRVDSAPDAGRDASSSPLPIEPAQLHLEQSGLAGGSALAAGHADAAAASSATPDVAEDADAIDAVYTWVNPSDPVWAEEATRIIPTAASNGSVVDGAKGNKFREWNELLYSMRSLNTYAPWVRNIYIVTSGPTQVPPWLNVSHPRIRVVHHAAIFDDPENQLPTYNSFAIESVLHRIPGLSNYFLYLNNDFLLGRDVLRSDFITDDGAYVRYQDWGFVAPPKCRSVLLRSRGLGTPPDDDMFLPCRNEVNGWDLVLAIHYWGYPITHWFVHMPHLWERRVLYAVEATLAPHLAVTRRSRVRNVMTDVNIHVHYESWRGMMAMRGDTGELRIINRATKSLKIRDKIAYFFVVFDNGCEGQFYGKLDAALEDAVRPLFVAIDDDLLQPTKSIIAYNRERLTLRFQRNWPIAGPWELPDRVPPKLDPSQCVATPPPPPPSPKPPLWALPAAMQDAHNMAQRDAAAAALSAAMWARRGHAGGGHLRVNHRRN